MPGPEATGTVESAEAIRHPSHRLMSQIAQGNFEASGQLSPIKPTEVHKNSFIALNNQNTAKRKNDAVEFARKRQAEQADITDVQIRHLQFATWSSSVAQTLGHDLGLEGRGNRTATILRDKLHLTLSGGGKQDGANLIKQFYNIDKHEAGSFYREFCGTNMNEALAHALTVEDMMHLKGFLRDWMVGSEEAFNALVALRATQDAIAQKAELKPQSQLTTDVEKRVLDFYRTGWEMEEKKQQQNPTTPPQPEPGPEQNPVKAISGSKTEKSDYHKENEDSLFIDTDHLRGGIFDGAGGQYRGDLASQAAQKAVEESLAKLPATATLEETKAAMAKAMQEANEKVLQIPLPQGEVDRPITTGTIFQIWKGPNGEQKLIWVSIGDSRLWVKDANGDTHYVTQDDNKAKHDFKQGKLTEEQYRDIQHAIDTADTEQAKNALGQYWDQSGVTAMLGDKSVTFEPQVMDITPEMMIFLTTDGVHDNLTKTQIAEIAKQAKTSDELATQLVAKAKEVSRSQSPRHKPDDISALTLTFQTTNQQQP